MRVLIDTTFARRAPLSGTGVYLARLCEALQSRADIHVITTYNPRRHPPAGGGAGSLRNLASDLWWTNQELPRRARRERADVIHHPLPAQIHQDSGLPQVITVHDLAFERCPKDFDRRFRAYAHLTHRAAARAASAVIAVSHATAADARELWQISDDRIVVAHHGPGQLLRAGTSGRDPTAVTRSRYFLYVGDDEPRKDVTSLLNAYSRYRLAAGGRPADLVLAGSAAGVNAPGVQREAHPDPRRLRQLYTGAVALVHPARYEGFGMTVLEGMALGVPVIAARSPAVAEVCGEAALLVTPGRPIELAAALHRVASEPSLRNRLSARGRERATSFSWARSAQRHVAAYSLALEQ